MEGLSFRKNTHTYIQECILKLLHSLRLLPIKMDIVKLLLKIKLQLNWNESSTGKP